MKSSTGHTHRIVLATILYLLSQGLGAQPITIHLNVSAHPNPDISTWATHTEVAILTVSNPGPQVDAKLDAKVDVGGTLKAITKFANMPVITIPKGVSTFMADQIVPFNAAKFFGDVDKAVGKTGRLPAGTYQLCVQLDDPKSGLAITQPDCKFFTITSYQAPQLLQPPNGAELTGTPMPVFRWTPVMPAPYTPAHYQLRIMEILPGQSPIQSFQGNQPIVDYDVLQPQTIWLPEFTPLKNGMKYVWSVLAHDDMGNPIGDPNGYASPFTFTVLGARIDGSGTDTSDTARNKLADHRNGNLNSNESRNGTRNNSDSTNASDATHNGEEAGTPNSLAWRDARGYVGGKYALTLDGIKIDGFVQPPLGGSFIPQSSTNAGDVLGQSIRNQTTEAKSEGVTFTCGVGMSKAFYDWINSSFTHQYTRKDGAIIGANYDHKEISRLTFYHALISEVGLPALDASSKDPAKMTIKILPESIHTVNKSDSSKKIVFNPTMQKQWTCSNFRFKIDGLNEPCKKVTKIESIVLKQKNIEHAVGDKRDYEQEPAILEIPNLVITCPEGHSNEFNKLMVVPLPNLNGVLEYQTTDLQPLFTLSLNGLHVISIKPISDGNSSITLSCEEMGIVPGGGVNLNNTTSTTVKNKLLGTGLDNAPPTVSIIRPVDGDFVSAGSPITIKFIANDNDALSGIIISMTTDGGSTFSDMMHIDGNRQRVIDQSVDVIIPENISAPSANIRVTATDASGNVGRAMSGKLVFGVNHSPTSHRIDVLEDGKIIFGVHGMSGLPAGGAAPETKPGKITFTKDWSNTSEWYKWRKSVIDGKTERKSISIIIRNDAGELTKRYNFFECYPTKWEGPAFDSNNSSQTIESIELHYERAEYK